MDSFTIALLLMPNVLSCLLVTLTVVSSSIVRFQLNLRCWLEFEQIATFPWNKKEQEENWIMSLTFHVILLYTITNRSAGCVWVPKISLMIITFEFLQRKKKYLIIKSKSKHRSICVNLSVWSHLQLLVESDDDNKLLPKFIDLLSFSKIISSDYNWVLLSWKKKVKQRAA